MLVNYSLKYTYILFQFQFEDFLESEFLNGQVEIIKKLSDHVTILKKVDTGLGEYIFDKEL
jgi:ferritin heavy chain